MCLNTGTPKNINFSFETNGKLMALGVPILKHFRVFSLPFLTIFSLYKSKVQHDLPQPELEKGGLIGKNPLIIFVNSQSNVVIPH